MKLPRILRLLDVKSSYHSVAGDNNPGQLLGKARAFASARLEEAAIFCREARVKLMDIPGTNYRLGLYHMQGGNLDDAIYRFRFVTWLVPEMAAAYYNLARCLIIKGDNDGAKQQLGKALSLQKDYPAASYALQKITAPETINEIPAEIISEQLASQAADSDNEKTAVKKDKILTSALLAHIQDKNPNLILLDIGCGRGGRAQILRDKEVVRQIAGIDISAPMIKAAKARNFNGENLYNELYNVEMRAFLSDNNGKFDAVMAGDVFSYNVDVSGTIGKIVTLLKNGGFFAILLKDYSQVTNIDEYLLDIKSDKFLHSFDNITNAVLKEGLEIKEQKVVKIEDVKYNLIIAAKN